MVEVSVGANAYIIEPRLGSHQNRGPVTDSSTTKTPVVTFTKTKPGGRRGSPTTEYSALLNTVRDAGLLRRRTGFYYLMFSLITLALGGVITGFNLLGDSWFQLLKIGRASCRERVEIAVG